MLFANAYLLLVAEEIVGGAERVESFSAALVASLVISATVIVLLVNGGTSRGNLLSGEADEASLTVSRNVRDVVVISVDSTRNRVRVAAGRARRLRHGRETAVARVVAMLESSPKAP
jgi:hypothetical protein